MSSIRWPGRTLALVAAAALAAAVQDVPSAAVAASDEPAAAETAVAEPQLLPQPVSTTRGEGRFTLTSGTRIVPASESQAALGVARDLAACLRPATGLPLPVTTGRGPSGDIVLSIGDPGPLAADPGGEGYKLSVRPGGVTLTARTAHGLFNGVQTIRQLLPPWIDSPTVVPGPWAMPAVTVSDHPRYPYRGLMLDIARHPESPAAVERLIDQISTFKVNVLHLHIGDDQGFRIAIRGFPNLTTIGAQGAVGTGGRTLDPGGFWTQEQYRSVVAHAASRFVTIVPEVDSPGHTDAIIMSEFNDAGNRRLDGHPQDINCGKNNPPVFNFTGAVGYSVLCPESQNTVTIMTEIVRQLSAMSPGPYYHIGGDEVRTALLSQAQYASFVNHEVGIVQTQHKTVMGWADIAGPGTDLTSPSVAEYWRPASGSSPGTITATEAAQKGMKIVMAPASHAYMDQKYIVGPAGKVPASLGLNWACHQGCDVDSAFDWDPATFVTGVASNVIGVEAPTFSETLTSLSDVDYMVFPRLTALAEIAWSPTADRTSATSPAFLDFVKRLAAMGTRMMAGGFNFYPSREVPWGLGVEAPNLVSSRHGRVSGRVAGLAAPGFASGAITATIDWGDGVTSAGTVIGTPATDTRVNSLYTVSGEHTYRHPGRFQAVVTVSAPNAASASATFFVRSPEPED